MTTSLIPRVGSRAAAAFAACCGLFFMTSTHAAGAVDGASTINSGDTAWMLMATALVLFMMIPGLALFYAGLVRAKNVLSILMQCFALTAVLSIVWLICGYSLAFTDGNSLVGGWQLSFLSGIGPASPPRADAPGIPVLLHFAYQMMFFLITPGLFIGAFAERMKFKAILVFSVLWSLLVYIPVCHGVWHAGSFCGLKNVIDLAGGIVVHVTAGVAALVACIMVGPRTDHLHTQMPPHHLPFTVAGAGMLWVGWFGFNAGSHYAANGDAAMSLVVTHLSACSAAVAWMMIEWVKGGKPSALGIATGSIAGLAAITPAAGMVGPIGALVIGAVSACMCWLACAKLKQKFKYDDSLDVFGVHGVGGFVGTVLVAIFGSRHFAGGSGDFAIGTQLATQLTAALGAAVLSAGVTFGLLKLIGATIGLRVTREEEHTGLDLAEHGEEAYTN